MKTLLTTIVLFALAPIAFASTVSITPASMSVVPGQTFSVTLVVSPDAAPDYTAKVALSYPAALLQVVSFTQSSGWLPLSQPGYDTVDNANGSLVKTAGYAGGFSSTKVFGTVTFRAVAAGNATITSAAGTQILDANNVNTFTSGGRAAVTITSPAVIQVVPVQKSTPTTNTSNPSRAPLTQKKPALAVAAATTTLVLDATTTPVATTTTQTSVAAAASASSREVSLSVAALAALFTFVCGIFVGRLMKKFF